MSEEWWTSNIWMTIKSPLPGMRQQLHWHQSLKMNATNGGNCFLNLILVYRVKKKSKQWNLGMIDPAPEELAHWINKEM